MSAVSAVLIISDTFSYKRKCNGTGHSCHLDIIVLIENTHEKRLISKHTNISQEENNSGLLALP